MATPANMKPRNIPAKLLLVMVVGIPATIFLFVDFLHSLPSPTDRLVQGQVVGREMGTAALGIQRPLLTVQLDDADVLVQASLSMNDIDDMPDHVTFYYSGDPGREVYLQEETNPIWGTIILVIVLTGGFIWIFAGQQ